MRSVFTSLVWGLVLLLTSTASHAGVTVLFEDGRSLVVSHIEKEGNSALMTLAGGGQIMLPIERIANWPKLEESRNPTLEPDADDGTLVLSAETLVEILDRAAKRHGFDPALLMALSSVESIGTMTVDSPAALRDLLALEPEIARRIGAADASEPDQIVEAAARHLSELLDRYEGRTDLALAAYHAGEDAVNRHRGIPPYIRTRQFVNRVLRITGQSDTPVTDD